MCDDLQRVNEHPEWQERSNCHNWENKDASQGNESDQETIDLVNRLFVLRVDLSVERPVQSGAEEDFLVLITLEVLHSPEGDGESVELRVVGDVTRIQEVKLDIDEVSIVGNHGPGELDGRAEFILRGNEELKSIDKLHQLVRPCNRIRKVHNVGLPTKHLEVLVRSKLSSTSGFPEAVLFQLELFL